MQPLQEKGTYLGMDAVKVNGRWYRIEEEQTSEQSQESTQEQTTE